MSVPDFLFILKWWTTFFLLGITFLPLTAKFFPKFIDKGYIFSKVFGLIVVSYVLFIISSLHILPFTFVSIIVVWAVLTVLILFLLRNERLELKTYIKLFITEEFIFFITLLFWSYIRSFQPSIHDLEKFMDFGFLNSILRSQYFPPKDMWLTPLPINYYYFGHLFTAVLTKISGVPSYISFNLMISSIFALTFLSGFSIGINLVQQIKKFSLKKTFIFGLFFGYMLSLSGNLQTIYSFFKGYSTESPQPFWKLILSISTFPNSYWYPNATRFIYRTIHEFPSYSFVVADLHGHVLDIPVVMALVALLFSIFLNKKITTLQVIFSSLLLSVSYMTNAWDGLIYIGLYSLSIFTLEFLFNKKGTLSKRVITNLFYSSKNILLILLFFVLFSFVFNKNFSPFASGIGLNCSPNFLLSLGKLGPFVFEKGQCQHSPLWQLLILYGFFFYMVSALMLFLRKRKLLISDLFVLTISIFSFMLIIIPEFFYLRDIYTGYFRANTMFKLAYQAFIMFSLSSSYVLIRIISDFRQNKKTKATKFFYLLFILGSCILIFLVAIYPYFSIPSGYGNLNKYQGLNGITYLKQLKPSDYLAINWLNKNVSNQPVILEAQGDSYTDFARISANTGLPTVLGWTVHEWLWRGSYSVPAARFDDIKNLYETPNPELAKSIIKKYNISLIYVGGMEKDKYRITEDKFKKLGKLIYSNSNTNIYKITGESLK